MIYPPFGGLKENLHTFEKLDGSNLRFEWSKKKGWYKIGTRHRLLDETDLIFGKAPALFQETLAEPCEKICRDQRWQRAIIFCEYYGPNSFAGCHEEDDTMTLTVIDVNPYKKGLLPPTDFLKLFGHLGPHYLGYIKWNYDFISKVHQSLIPEASFEGVVGKAKGKGNTIDLYKTKTQAWKDEVKRRFNENEAAKLLKS